MAPQEFYVGDMQTPQVKCVDSGTKEHKPNTGKPPPLKQSAMDSGMVCQRNLFYIKPYNKKSMQCQLIGAICAI